MHDLSDLGFLEAHLVCSSGYVFAAETQSGSWVRITGLGFYRAYAVDCAGVPIKTFVGWMGGPVMHLEAHSLAFPAQCINGHDCVLLHTNLFILPHNSPPTPPHSSALWKK